MSVSDTPDPERAPREQPASSDRKDRPALSPEQVLAWADAFYARHGRWPQASSGLIDAAGGETWLSVDTALRKGQRGLRGGSSLYRLIKAHRPDRATGLVDEGISDPDPTPRRKQRAPDLEIEQILAWADAHYERTGEWPHQRSGPIAGAAPETWIRVDAALRKGSRSLPPGSSLARLLAQHRGVRNIHALPDLTEEQILAWADAHHERTGQWPRATPEPIVDAHEEVWRDISICLHRGLRGLPGGTTLARLLAQRRGVRHPVELPALREEQILAWADAHRARTGEWPIASTSGLIPGAPGDTWRTVDYALREGGRGLQGGSSLSRLLAQRRGRPHPMQRPPLTVAQILAWADAHHARTGRWPRKDSGAIPEATGEYWSSVDASLGLGHRGLPGGSSLARLLAEQRAAPRGNAVRAMSEAQFLAWVEAHPPCAGIASGRKAGTVSGAPGETSKGPPPARRNALPRSSSRDDLLAWHREARRGEALPTLTETQILAWADAHHERAGRWPTAFSGLIEEAPGETWLAVDKALRRGSRGLPEASSLARMLEEQRGVINYKNRPPLSPEQILAWADAHFARHGRWPQVLSGPIEDAPGETWSGVNAALEQGARTLPGGSSLAKLLAEHRGARNRRGLPKLTEPQVVAWADAYHTHHGRWPQRHSGPVEEAPGETWMAVDQALRNGLRGFPGGSSLSRLIKEHREG
jgi:hypothetical protein